ncbi:hypothetical protein [Phytohabitans aurantiacus]|uniref:Uncharacterized protein n=1 Tax=Phytohabitans aurantiacus TaxID=3016789 RepID=A0ABQ5QNW9_9ACTN|nr:hypothetical protein [Phytohabitans aurantiacus]GLH95929.1 hypothetical protein Pa4123_12010 [Phytohabitans aurantiacus]
MYEYLRLTITDTLGVWIDGNHAVNPLAKVTRTFWYRLPGDWVSGDALVAGRLDRLVDAIYGQDWREGNPDGSRYVILGIQEKVLSDHEADGKPWLSDRAAFYVVDAGDTLREVIPAEL